METTWRVICDTCWAVLKALMQNDLCLNFYQLLCEKAATHHRSISLNRFSHFLLFQSTPVCTESLFFLNRSILSCGSTWVRSLETLCIHSALVLIWRYTRIFLVFILRVDEIDVKGSPLLRDPPLHHLYGAWPQEVSWTPGSEPLHAHLQNIQHLEMTTRNSDKDLIAWQANWSLPSFLGGWVRKKRWAEQVLWWGWNKRWRSCRQTFKMQLLIAP